MVYGIRKVGRGEKGGGGEGGGGANRRTHRQQTHPQTHETVVASPQGPPCENELESAHSTNRRTHRPQTHSQTHNGLTRGAALYKRSRVSTHHK